MIGPGARAEHSSGAEYVPAGASAPTMIQEIGFASDSPLKEVGFELLVLQSSSSAVLTPDARAGHIRHVLFSMRTLHKIRRATVLSLQASHTLSGKAGQLQT